MAAAPGGHRYFVESGTGLVGVADQSGYYPEETYDGVLYLDPSRPIVADDHQDHVEHVPLLTPDDKRTSTPVYVDEAELVAEMFGMVRK